MPLDDLAVPTVDDVLGPKPPTVDDVLGPAPSPGFSPDIPTPLPSGAIDSRSSPADRLLDLAPVGRVLDAFMQGARHGWGDRALGLTPDAERALRESGIYPTVQGALSEPLRAFNEGLIRPAAITLDALMRGVSSLTHGAAGATGQVAEELGASPAMARRLTRDTLMMADTLGILSGSAPLAPRGASGRSLAAHEVETPKVVEKPTLPEQLIPNSEYRAGNINLSRINAPEDVKDVIRKAAEAGDSFGEARRGEISLAQTESLAHALGMSPADLMKRKPGEAFNAEQATAARNLLVQSATEVRMSAVKAAGGTDADILAFQEAMARHMAIQEQVAGLTAEAGRALSSFRIMAQASRDARDLGKAIEQLGGRANIEGIARRLGELDTPQQVSKFLMDARQARTSDMLLEVWINALLSGPQTHATNVISNTLVALWSVPETATAAAIGKILGSGDDAVRFGEAGARIFGFAQGAKDGVIAGWRTFRSETPSTSQTTIDVQRQRAIPSARVSIGGKDFDIGGKQIRIPGRALMAEDEFFKAIAYRQEINALAYRQAAKEGLADEAFAVRVAELVNNPTDEMSAAARANADYQTFTKELGKMGRAVQDFVNSHPSARVIIPFVRTPINIVKYASDHSPLGLFSQEVRENLSGANGVAARDTQLARIVTGSALGAAAASLAAEGLVTGAGPTDSRQKAVRYLTGWQPYSVRIGDVYYSFGRLEPLGTLMGVAADMHDVAAAMDELAAEKVAHMIVASISKNLVNKTWLRGPSELIQAVSDPERYGERWLQRMAGTLVPTGVAQIARVEDPYLRDAQSVLDAVRARVPGLSSDLLPRRDIWGEPIILQGSFGPDALSPIYESQIKNDPIAQELIALKIWPGQVEKKIRGVKLTAQQYDDYQRVAGRLTRYMLQELVQVPEWFDLPEYARRQVIVGNIGRAREAARALIMMQNPDIIQQATEAKVKQITGPKRAQP